MNSRDHGAAMRQADGAAPMCGLPAAAPYPESVWPTISPKVADHFGLRVGGPIPLRPDVDPDAYLDALQLGAHVNLYVRIEASAAEMHAWVKRECSVLRRATSQHFRWASVLRSAPPPRA